MAWLLGMTTTTVLIGSLINKAFTGEWPQELKDYAFPKVGKDASGNPIRISLPTYFRDAFNLSKDVPGYIRSSMSGLATRIIEAMQNRDFYGNYVYDPNDPDFKKAIAFINHAANPAGILPFSVQQLTKFREEKAPTATQALGFFGFTKAPREVIETPFEREVRKVYNQKFPHKPLTPAEQTLDKEKRELRKKIRAGQFEDLEAAVQKGLVSPKGLRTFLRDAQSDPLKLMFSRLPKSEQERLLPLATPEERERLGR